MESIDMLLKIEGLNISSTIHIMDDKHLQMYTQSLDEFVDTYPTQENTLKNAMTAKDYEAYPYTLSIISMMLKAIQADDLVESCQKLQSELNTAKQELVDAHLTSFLAQVAALSINIQMRNMQDHPAQQPEIQTSTVLSPDRKNILAVDDDSLVLHTIKSILIDSEYNFVGAPSGAAAMRYLSNHTPDLFILDIEMPEMNGYELAQTIRGNGHISPIIFLTGNATKDYVFKAIQVGAVDFIIKPIDVTQVLSKIQKNIWV